ncbi:MAG: hypothetical protein COX90_02000 [Candidatus Nealsonbacteria bacterium CG_4_10_14_0_2_um_filter_38_17]|uniref:Uncharacterized protein n=2 Tax=Candidatus Nealsoniibacteriota TaxID=1817911 RepID=A0A2M7UYA4_9BACT|nr:MAG: hypothetical protein COX36_01375 [Candidatus Nealsonbacteria bacterium CG23_combo_of_CG06-09_8_20_14_all_38_19]PIZ88937.1 MAG: hypothetical protein COX90_02000 [Candidatus Nealsonbacteria bacterium CG_4_10_14_0_2_um_filter_38_17]
MQQDFLQQRKKQRYLVLVFAGAIFVILLLIWSNFFNKPSSEPTLPSPGVVIVPKEIKINTDILKDPRLGELQPYEEIAPFTETDTEKIGRKNPFVSF